MISIGLLPKRLGAIKPPPCLACLLGKSKHKPYRTKGSSPSIRHLDHATPGTAVSVDQLVSSTPGLKPQAIGNLTKASIVGAQVFADHCSSPPFLHCHLLENFTGEATIKAKVGFERLAATHNVTIKHYRADNGRFADEDFLHACLACNQTVDYCGVGAHIQNGIAESNIGHLQDATRAMLLHAMHHWPDMVSVELWPLAMLKSTRISNQTRFTIDGRSPLAHFSKSDAMFHLADEHTFGCPVYVLDSRLQNQNKIPK